jgi:hypothetical protein
MQNRVPTSDGRDAFIRSKPIGGGRLAVRPPFILVTLNNFVLIARS